MVTMVTKLNLYGPALTGTSFTSKAMRFKIMASRSPPMA